LSAKKQKTLPSEKDALSLVSNLQAIQAAFQVLFDLWDWKVQNIGKSALQEGPWRLLTISGKGPRKG
jgi:hypothetical protein